MKVCFSPFPYSAVLLQDYAIFFVPKAVLAGERERGLLPERGGACEPLIKYYVVSNAGCSATRKKKQKKIQSLLQQNPAPSSYKTCLFSRHTRCHDDTTSVSLG
jgi:hypothetical protein